MKNVFRWIGWIIPIWIAISLIEYSECTPKYSAKGSNLCTRIEWFQKNTTVPRTENVKVTRKRFCSRPPFICSYDDWDTKIVEEVVPVNYSRTVAECCEGYDNMQGSCVPKCHPECGHGECVAPNMCFCDEGWKQPLCLQECDSDHYGRDCMVMCRCENGATCDKKDGSCLCAPGYTGDYCQDTCPGNVYGDNCAQECKCQNNAICNNVDGSCDCQPGFTGQYCEEMCGEGNHGKNCEDECVCVPETTELCHHVTGECVCKPGYSGMNCENTCGNFTYGRNCTRKCNCDTLHTAFCDPADGFCVCKPGWDGYNCSETCPVGKFGEFCSFDCTPCPTPSATCNPETGFCDCPPGSFGDMCHKSCPEGWWGSNCTNKCNCTDVQLCNLVTGHCISLFPPDYYNLTEHVQDCHDTFWFTNCSTHCKCRDNEECLPLTGGCLPRRSSVTYSDIGHTDYPIVCPDGWWGLNCSEKCACGYSGDVTGTMCNRMTGRNCIFYLGTVKTPEKEKKPPQVVWTLVNKTKLNLTVSSSAGPELDEIGQSRKNHDQVVSKLEKGEHVTTFTLGMKEEEMSQSRRNYDQVADCGPNYYGPGCKFKCSCPKERICDGDTGACVLQHKSVSFADMSRGNKIAVYVLIPLLCLAVLAFIVFALQRKGFIPLDKMFMRRNGSRNIGTNSCAASTDYIVGDCMNNPMYGCHDDVVVPLDGPQFERGPSIRYSRNAPLQAAFFNECDQESRKSVPITGTQRSSAVNNLKNIWPKPNSEQETKGPAQETFGSTSVQFKEDPQRLSVLSNLKSMWLKENGKVDTHSPAKEPSDSTSDKFEDDFITSAMESIYDENRYESVPPAKENSGAADKDKKPIK